VAYVNPKRAAVVAALAEPVDTPLAISALAPV
jgi:hypothetical protein